VDEKRRKILLIEDDPDDEELTIRVFKKKTSKMKS
jgi:hypothetical protein